MPKPTPPVTARIDLARARLAWADRQGLRAPLGGELPALVGRTGWVRTLGGVDVYLAVRARSPGMRRADLEREVEARALQVVPAVRGCIYLVPRAQVPLVMRVAEELSRPTRSGRRSRRAWCGAWATRARSSGCPPRCRTPCGSWSSRGASSAR